MLEHTFDLKHAFGEVHHHCLLNEVLSYHHIPQQAQVYISRLYDNFHTSILTYEYTTSAIPVRVGGVLQGDCLRPLLYNMCFNTFLQYIRQENTNTLASLHMMKMIVYTIPYTGSNLQVMLQYSRQTHDKFNYYSTALLNGVSGLR